MKIKVWVSILAACLLSVSCQSGGFHLNCGISETSQIGINHLQPLVEAMERYKKDVGKYPKNFDELPARYLDRIPIIVTGREESVDKERFNVLQNDGLKPGLKEIEPDGSFFSIGFISTDDRVCLMGRNNLCEYSSQSKSWNCHQ